MGKISKLPDKIVNQIAAGEVVERPVAVVKELVENSLDAGATRIEIVFERGGKSLIRISDNGYGMERGDAELAVERHATSKISEVDDLLKLHSFGFRGEALPSIASVSRFSLRTRRAEDAEGTEIRINGGKGKDVQSCGMSPGTVIEVAQLFNSVPARRKFLKTDRTEAAHIIHMSRLLAIANPKVAFVLIEDGREVFNSPVCHRLEDRVAEIYGRQKARELMPIEAKRDDIRMSGLISKSGVSRSVRSEMISFVNGRPVDSRLINYALIESYHSYLPRGRYPLSFLFIEIRPDLVDVNVHPAKREVRFRDEGGIRQFLMENLIRKLREETGKALGQVERVQPIRDAIPAQDSVGTTNQSSTEGVSAKLPSPSIRPPVGVNVSPLSEAKPVEDLSPVSKPDRHWRFLNTYGTRYGLFDSGNALLVVDGVRAQYRIKGDDILRQMEAEAVRQQDFLIPVLIELEPLEASIIKEYEFFFDSLGFELESFGGHSYRLRSYPAWFDGETAQAFLKDLIQKIGERGIRPDQAKSARESVAQMAVRRMRFSAVHDWNQLADALLSSENPLTDLEGRATLIRLSASDIERRFGNGF